LNPQVAAALREGQVIPAHPLALTAARKLDERRQRALTRYYAAAGAGGIAVAVHTTQFEIRDPAIGLLQPVLELAAETARECDRRLIRIAGVCGPTAQAVSEASLARDLGYDIALLSMAALPTATDDELIDHARTVGEIMPLFGFYLQSAVGGRDLGYAFWRRFAEIPSVVAIKIAPFDRYKTLDVVRGVADSGRADDVTLYTGNDDNIVHDLVTAHEIRPRSLRMVGGLLGHWAVWTHSAVELLRRIKGGTDTDATLALAAAVTDSNAAFFDVAHRYRGCIAGLHEVLRRQGLLDGIWCLDPEEGLSPGQAEEIDRVHAAYPDLNDDEFVAEHLDLWMQ
jgi:dihydrodipicolinate synthase/N-acetylneuraminate lyase